MQQKQIDELKNTFQEQIDNLKGKSVDKETIDGIQAKQSEILADLEKSATKEEMEKATEELEALKTSLHKMNEKLEKGKSPEKPTSLKRAIVDLMKTDDFKSRINAESKAAFDLKGVNTKGFVTKAAVDSDDSDGDEYRSALKPGITFSKLTENTIAPIFNMVTVPPTKDRIVWLEGSSSITVGYVNEGNAQSTDSGGSTTTKSRELAKISAVMPFTSEALDMPESFAGRLQRRMIDETNVWLDQELLTGDGDDSSDPKHIYGIINKGSTAFSAPSGLTFTDPTIDDLVDAMNVQASPYKPTHILMNLKTKVKYSRVKDETGQYVIREVNGLTMLGGLQVVISEGMGDDELMTLDRSTLEFWIKEGMRLIVTQMAGTDIADDKWRALLFWKGQTLVENPDKAGNIYVSDIAAALEDITEVEVTG